MNLPAQPSPIDLLQAYVDGLPGAPCDPVLRDQLVEDGTVKLFGSENYADIKDLHKSRPRVLLFRYLRQYDPTALSDEAQTTGDCTSHGSRNSGDLSRSTEIATGQAEEFVARGATEYIYAGRGHRGQGMNAGRATKILTAGQMLRLDYSDQGGPDLRKYNAKIGMGYSQIPEKWQQIAAAELAANTFITPRTVEEALDAIAAGYGGHAGSMYGTSQETGPDGLNLKTDSWSHDMAHAGYDLTCEIWREPVVFIPNSWKAWNKPNPLWDATVMGPWIPGMIVCPLDIFERHILRPGEIYYMVEFEGERIKARDLPDWGFDYA